MSEALGAQGPWRRTLRRVAQRLRLRALQIGRDVAEWAAFDGARAGLWTPVAFGAGAAFYLTARTEPAPWLAPLLMVVSAILAWKASRVRLLAIAAAIAFAGFAAADLRAHLVAAPMLKRETGFVDLSGRLLSVDESPRSRRIVIAPDKIEGLTQAAIPARVRLTWRGSGFDVHPGDLIAMRAKLSPPPPPVAPRDFDFARQLYFQRIGAVGFAVSAPRALPEAGRPMAARIIAWIETKRLGLTRRIIEKAPGDGGAIVAAMITGKREAISAEAEAALRDSGLAHLIAISGLNMALATGLIFFVVRASLALIEPVALRWPIKKWAAVAALAAGAAYLVISGGAWSAQRAFIMTAIFLIAILFDRRALSLRNLAIAAMAILLFYPEAVLHPGFQMSFAAATALIAAYEWGSAHADPLRSFAWPARVRRYLVGIAITDIVAALATAPYSLYHFNRAANFSLPANVIAIPIIAFLVMPAAIAALLLAPFGVDGPVWRFAALGVEAILAVARWAAALPGAVTVIPQWPGLALAALTLGGLWLCLNAAPWRIAGLLALPIAAILIVFAPQEALFISAKGDNAAFIVEGDQGRPVIAAYDQRKSRFAISAWKERAGIDAAKAKTQRIADYGTCDEEGCVATIRSVLIAFSDRRSGLDDDCLRADLVIAFYPTAQGERRACAARLIDRRDAWENGAHAVRIAKNGAIVVESVEASRAGRPWSAN